MKTPDEIKESCENCYEIIRMAEERLKELRTECKHEKTFIGDYMWAPGHILRGKICMYCGTFINTNENLTFTTITKPV